MRLNRLPERQLLVISGDDGVFPPHRGLLIRVFRGRLSQKRCRIHGQSYYKPSLANEENVDDTAKSKEEKMAHT